ncbi:MAG: hypothetical protein Q7L55_06040, partial [Actinomycetota bacterium]|nr:hypothetical protein [Actinomycetota bacterium]
GSAVRLVLEKHGLGYRAQERRTRLDHVTVSRMASGYVPSMPTVIQFAQGFGLDVNEWLELAGYPRIEPSLTDSVRTVVTHAEELTYEPEFDEVDVSGFHGAENLSPHDREVLNRVARAFLSEKRRRAGR